MTSPHITHCKKDIHLHGRAEEFIRRRIETLSERLPKINFTRYANSLIAFDCWAEMPHEFSGPAAIAGGVEEDWLWQDVADDFGKTKNSEWFATRFPEILRARIERAKGCEQLPQFARRKFTIRTPELANEVIQARMSALGMTVEQYLTSLIAYDCWCERPHSITGPSCNGKPSEEFILWAEIVRDFGLPGKTRGWFGVRLEEIRQRIPPEE